MGCGKIPTDIAREKGFEDVARFLESATEKADTSRCMEVVVE
jgi:hypothetical protein